MANTNEKLHTAENCDINTHSNLVPGEDDCGHYVSSGPGTVDLGGDLNSYEKSGKKAIIAGMPSHNLDQDVSHGPGVGVAEYDGKGGTVVAGTKPSSANSDQDPTHGPGVQ